MSNLVDHAKREFEILGWPGDDDMQKWVCDGVIELLETFSSQGHSGFSASYALSYFKALAAWDTISPLTGKEDEWVRYDDMYQNKRDSSVFKRAADGEAFWIYGKIFEDSDGGRFTNGDSHTPVEFPWTKPESEIVKVED